MALLLISGLGVAVWGAWDAEDLVAWGEVLVDRPSLLLVVIVLQALLFTLALPGSALLWVVALSIRRGWPSRPWSLVAR
ncbi:MAG: hypothetical protein ACLFMS_05995 [Halorhodospira sp.]